MKEYEASYRLRHPDRVKEIQSRYYYTNRVKCLAQDKQYREQRIDQARADGRKRFRKDWAAGEHERAEVRRSEVQACGCCGATEPRHKKGWLADHDHATGLFRDFLCHPCNVIIGWVEKYQLDLRSEVVSTYLGRFKT